MPSADSALPAALAALARAARSLRDAPAPERDWRLRQLIGDAARVAALGGADPLSLAQEAWHAATDAAARPGSGDAERSIPEPAAAADADPAAPPGPAAVERPAHNRAAGADPADELAARRLGRDPVPFATRATDRRSADRRAPVLPFRRPPR